ncbi:MAG: GIY-YIG nuclease family protein [Bacteroidetes bacterium]|nr:GIY-YIG nuclease family protein [Bacteroidota bacterium]MBX7044651.1 GIY-YIG nuclease family protein [Ignavibacteria bacterium]
MFYAYILKSTSTGKMYIGHTDNLETRLKEHNAKGKTLYTNKKGPWKILWSREFPDRGGAMNFENSLKRMKNKKEYILQLTKK